MGGREEAEEEERVEEVGANEQFASDFQNGRAGCNAASKFFMATDHMER